MSETYVFETGFDFSSWAMQFDQFHDWVIVNVRVFADADFQTLAQQYSAELVIADPYERFDIKKIFIGFENVETASFQGLSSLGSELAGLVFKKVPVGVRLSSTSENHLRIDAEKMSVSSVSKALS